MSLLVFARDERVIVFGLAAAAVGVVATMRMFLSRMLDEAEIKQQQPTTQYITQETEDSLKPNTLETLLAHYNYAIREIAGKIVTDRAVNDSESLNYLLWGITRPDYDERLKCLRTLAYITDPQTIPKFNTPRAYAAFVRSLEHCLTDRAPLDKLDDKWFDEYGLRDMAEKLPLMFITQLIQKYGPEPVIKAGFVDKWVAKQNWGDTTEERCTNFSRYLFKHNRIAEIIMQIQECPIGVQALARARVLLAEKHPLLSDIELQAEFERQRLINDGPTERTPRHMEQSPEEQRLRHRHREAMVLNDGTRPLGRSDIIEREHNTPPP